MIRVNGLLARLFVFAGCFAEVLGFAGTLGPAAGRLGMGFLARTFVFVAVGLLTGTLGAGCFDKTLGFVNELALTFVRAGVLLTCGLAALPGTTLTAAGLRA